MKEKEFKKINRFLKLSMLRLNNCLDDLQKAVQVLEDAKRIDQKNKLKQK
jgi:hypothetical protein